MSTPEQLFWELAAELRSEEPRLAEGTIMGQRCLRLDGEFLALCDARGAGLVVKLPRTRVDELVGSGAGRAFAPAGRVFKEWVSIPQPDRQRWLDLMREGIAFVGRPPDRGHRPR